MTINDEIVELHAIYYHEAGHAVMDYLFRFRPQRIDGALSVHDRRASSFFRSRRALLATPKARERANDYAVSLVGGVVAESIAFGGSVEELRKTAGTDDYDRVEKILDRLMVMNIWIDSPETRELTVCLWEAKAKALLQQPCVWSAVEYLVNALVENEGVLDAAGINEAIRLGMTAENLDPVVESGVSNL